VVEGRVVNEGVKDDSLLMVFHALDSKFN
jgi:hypothetical protein